MIGRYWRNGKHLDWNYHCKQGVVFGVVQHNSCIQCSGAAAATQTVENKPGL